MNTNKNIAVIGLGNIAIRHRRNLKLLYPSCKITAVSSSGRSPTEAVSDADIIVRNFTDINMDKLDFAIIASPASFHKLHAVELIKNKIPVFIEKPITTSLEDANTLLQFAKDCKVPISVGYCLRYMPSFIKMKELISADFIGPVYNAFITVGQYLPDWRPLQDFKNSVSAKKILGGGALLELSHDIDYASLLLGPMSVEYATLRNTKELDLEVEEIADIILKNKSGVICSIHLDFLQKQVQRKCSIMGEKGRLDFDLLENTIHFHHTKGTDLIYNGVGWDKNTMYIDMISDFVRSIKEKRNDFVNAEQSIITLKLINDIRCLSEKPSGEIK
ncbi:MAG: Gfo/Idh/MocA family oxidoreductase [Emcibacter sp.]|nr:Gfo/Idh/MocA family oxidoreductase [Emcibacter sp.]